MYKNQINSKLEAGSQTSNEPRLLGSIVSEMLHGQSPLARGYRQYIVSQEKGEDGEQGWHTNTVPSCVLKTVLRNDKCMKVDKGYPGVLRRDESSAEFNFDEHYTFTEATFKSSSNHRNVHLFVGKYLTLTCRPDGSLRLNFRKLMIDANFSIETYCIGVMNEIRQALTGLLGK